MNEILDSSIFINKNRIDIVIGIEYVDFYENKYNTDFFIDLYIEYKRSFNGLKEDHYSGKNDFINRFNNLIDSMKEKKGNTIPIEIKKYNKEYWVVNGFHRASISYYYKLPLLTEVTKRTKKFGWYPCNINLFIKNKYNLKFCNYTMECFFKKYKKKFSCIIFFPSEKNIPDELFNIIKNDIIYKLEIYNNGDLKKFQNNFIAMLYYNEKWCIKGGYKGKSNECFSEKGYLKIFFIEKKELNFLNNYKNKVREFYKKDKNSIHVPDTQEECNNLIQLLNYNTIKFMEKSPSLYIKFKNFTILINKLNEFCKINNIDKKKICITSSAVLSVYRIRDCGDIDLFIDKKYVELFKNTCFDSHNKYSDKGHYSKNYEDIIYNPENYFYFQNFKFAKLLIIYNYKKYRINNNLFGEKSIIKDKKDINKIEEILF
jgi:hypothetical protein